MASAHQTQNSGPRPSDKWIPWYIVLFFVFITCVLSVFTWVAVTTHTGTVTDDAYQKGLAYNDTIHKADAQAAFGYVPALARAGDDIRFTLADAAGQAVDLSQASIWLFRPVNARDDLRADMRIEAGAAVFSAAGLAAGLWEVRVRAETPKGPYQYSKRMVFE